MNEQAENLRLMIVAGEASGDAHAAKLVRALRHTAPDVRLDFFGSTGREMRAAGVRSVVQADDLAIVGLIEIGRALPKFWQAYKTLKRAALHEQPVAAILVDWPDFNLRLAYALRRQGVKVIYYISPQLWAWRAYRARNIRRDVDLLLTVLPFETGWYNERGIRHVEFVGHPLSGEVRPRFGRAEFCRRHRLDPAQSIIALLPGSRRTELVYNLPPMLDAATIINRTRSSSAEVQFVIALAAHHTRAEVEPMLARVDTGNTAPLPQVLRIIEHETHEALAAADAAAVASGTATLEAALTETPLVVVYKVSALNWFTLRRLIKAEHFGLVNLVAGERVATELMQSDFTGERLAAELLMLLEANRNQAVRQRLRETTARLGTSNASHQAAKVILRRISEWRAIQIDDALADRAEPDLAN